MLQPPPAPAVDAAPLPVPWHPMIDRERGHTPFYLNNLTGETQWQHPFPDMPDPPPALPRASDGGYGEWWPGGTKPSAAELHSVCPLIAVMIGAGLPTQDSTDGVLNLTRITRVRFTCWSSGSTRSSRTTASSPCSTTSVTASQRTFSKKVAVDPDSPLISMALPARLPARISGAPPRGDLERRGIPVAVATDRPGIPP